MLTADIWKVWIPRHRPKLGRWKQEKFQMNQRIAMMRLSFVCPWIKNIIIGSVTSFDRRIFKVLKQNLLLQYFSAPSGCTPLGVNLFFNSIDSFFCLALLYISLEKYNGQACYMADNIWVIDKVCTLRMTYFRSPPPWTQKCMYTFQTLPPPLEACVLREWPHSRP